MTLDKAFELGRGSDATWNDPDNGLCSKTFTIRDIAFLGGEAFRITTDDGDELEVLAQELA